MKLSNHSAVPVYTISGSSSARPLPEWLAQKRKRSLKKDAEYSSRIELLQDFEFEEASQCVQVSDDGQWVMSTGTYKPQIHAHYLPHLALSFARHTTSLNYKFILLSSDYSKSVHLQADRSVEFHTPGGCHYTTRLPRYGRDVAYASRSTELLFPTAGVNDSGNGEVFRLNLEVGRYLRSFEIDVGSDGHVSVGNGTLQGVVNAGSVNVAAVAEDTHNLYAFGTSKGTVEFWDPRKRDCAASLHIPNSFDPNLDSREQVTALAYHPSGLSIAVGSSAGITRLYDLRSSQAFITKDQGYGFPIKSLIYLSSNTRSQSTINEPLLLSADKRIIKIWNHETGNSWTSVEPTVDLNSVAWCRESGMILTANEGRQQHTFFIPQLGPAPKWCSFLDNLVEEMSEDINDPQAYGNRMAGEVYENYKFLTREQLENLNLSHLVGTTTLLRPYMHGFFVSQKLYDEAKLIANPFIWEEQKSKRLQEKIQEERDSRIRGRLDMRAKVNKRFAEKLQAKDEKRAAEIALKAAKKAAKEGAQTNGEQVRGEAAVVGPAVPEKSNTLLSDPRFARLFQDEAYAIDENSYEFRALNASTKPVVQDAKPNGLTAVEEEQELSIPSSANSSDDDSVDENSDNDLKGVRGVGNGTASHTKESPKGPKGSSQRTPQIIARSSAPIRADRSFGSRREKSVPSKQPSQRVSGEQSMTFEPQKRSKAKPAASTDNGTKRRDGDRRSASGNVFRKM